MKIVAAVFACLRDQACLDVFVPMWQELHPNIELYLINDVSNQCSNTHDLPVVYGHWAGGGGGGQNSLASLSNVAIQSGADYVVKVDCDCIHTGKRWIDQLAGNPRMVGYENVTDSRCVFGACYAIRADSIAGAARYKLSVTAEDIAVSRMMNCAYQGEVKVIERGSNEWSFAGYHPDKPMDEYKLHDIIHCGQHQPRDQIAQTMQRILNRHEKPDIDKRDGI